MRVQRQKSFFLLSIFFGASACASRSYNSKAAFDDGSEKIDTVYCSWVGQNSDGEFFYRLSTKHVLTWSSADPKGKINLLPEPLAKSFVYSDAAREYLQENIGKYICILRKDAGNPKSVTIEEKDIIVTNSGSVEKKTCSSGISPLGSTGGLGFAVNGEAFPKNPINISAHFPDKAVGFNGAPACILYQDLEKINLDFIERNPGSLRFEKESFVIDVWLEADKLETYPIK